MLDASRPYTSATWPINSAPTMLYTFPGPLRQLVGTDTLISGISKVAVIGRVAVRVSVGVIVSVGVNVGGSGVKVNDAVEVISRVGEENSCGAFCVNPATTVCAAAVLIAPVSGVEMAGTAQAILAINNATTGK